MEKILSPDKASMVDQALSLIRKAYQINATSNYCEIDTECTCHNFWEYRVYDKVTQKIRMWVTVHFNYEFEEKYLTLNRVFNFILKYGILPENYPAYEG